VGRHQPFRRHTDEQEEGDALCAKEQSDVWDRWQVGDLLWARVRAWASKADIVVGVSYRPASPGEDMGRAFFKLFEDVSVSVSQTHDTSQKGSLAGHKQSRFLESTRGNFPIQAVDGPRRGNAQPDLLFTIKEALVGHVVINGSPSSSDHEMVVFKILREVRKEKCRAQILGIRRQNLAYSETQEQTIPKLRIPSKCIGRSAWISGEIMVWLLSERQCAGEGRRARLQRKNLRNVACAGGM